MSSILNLERPHAAKLVRRVISLFILLTSVAVFERELFAQSDWVRRLDANGNGYIEPNELSDRSRSFLERFAGEYGIDLNRTYSVRRIEEAASEYFSRRSRDSASAALTPLSSTVKGFGPEPDAPLIPDFASPIVPYPYNSTDMTDADELLRRYDRNRDGFLAYDEIDPNRWRVPSPQECDLDRDGRLSRVELAQRYARRRITEQQEAMTRNFMASQVPAVTMQDDRRSREAGSYERGPRGGSQADRGSRALAYSMIERFDFNKNGFLESREMGSTGIDIAKVDFNRDGKVERDELGDYLFEQMEREGNDLTELLPTWFFERDLNADQQIEMSEFTDEWTAEKAEEFSMFDANSDGIITADEILTSKQLNGGDYSNQEAKILLPRSIVVSEIQVDEDVIIGDLNVRLSITHSYTQQLDGYLIGPDGQRIELFAGVGGSDDHFDRTIFDDEASTNITRSLPPFRGSFQPGPLAKRQPGLSAFKGKSLKGVWQLMIRASRSDRSGVLHDWALLVEPDRDSVDRMLEDNVTDERVDGLAGELTDEFTGERTDKRTDRRVD
jgi:subtilisin-like proprotein convertase family protein